MSTANRQSRRQRGEAPAQHAARFEAKIPRVTRWNHQHEDIKKVFAENLKTGTKPTTKEFEAFAEARRIKRETAEHAYREAKINKFVQELEECVKSFKEETADQDRMFDFDTDLPLLAVILCEKIFKFRQKNTRPAEIEFVQGATGATEEQLKSWFSEARRNTKMRETGSRLIDFGPPVVFQDPEVLDLCEKQFLEFSYFKQAFYDEELATRGESKEEVLRWFRQQLQDRRTEYTDMEPAYSDFVEAPTPDLINLQIDCPETCDYLIRCVWNDVRPTKEEFESVATTIGRCSKKLKRIHRDVEKVKDRADLQKFCENFKKKDFVPIFPSLKMDALQEALCQFAFEKVLRRFPENRDVYRQLYLGDVDFISAKSNPKLKKELIYDWVFLKNRSLGRKHGGKKGSRSRLHTSEYDRQQRKERKAAKAVDNDVQDEEDEEEEEEVEDEEEEDLQVPGPSSSSGIKRRPNSVNRNPRAAKSSRTSLPVGNMDQDDWNPVYEVDHHPMEDFDDGFYENRRNEREDFGAAGTSGTSIRAPGTSRPGRSGGRNDPTEDLDDSEDSGAAGPSRSTQDEQRSNEVTGSRASGAERRRNEPKVSEVSTRRRRSPSVVYERQDLEESEILRTPRANKRKLPSEISNENPTGPNNADPPASKKSRFDAELEDYLKSEEFQQIPKALLKITGILKTGGFNKTIKMATWKTEQMVTFFNEQVRKREEAFDEDGEPEDVPEPAKTSQSCKRGIEMDLMKWMEGPVFRDFCEKIIEINGSLNQVQLPATLKSIIESLTHWLREFNDQNRSEKEAAFGGSGQVSARINVVAVVEEVQQSSASNRAVEDLRQEDSGANEVSDEQNPSDPADASPQNEVIEPEEQNQEDSNEVHQVEPEVQASGGEALDDEAPEASECGNDAPDDQEDPEVPPVQPEVNAEGSDAPEDAPEKQNVPEDVGDEVLEGEARQQLADGVVVPENAPEEGNDAENPEAPEQEDGPEAQNAQEDQGNSDVPPDEVVSGREAPNDVAPNASESGDDAEESEVPNQEGDPEDIPQSRDSSEDPKDNPENPEEQASDTEGSETPAEDSEGQGTSENLENHQEDQEPEDGHSEDDESIDVGGPDDRWTPEDRMDSDQVGHQQLASENVPEAEKEVIIGQSHPDDTDEVQPEVEASGGEDPDQEASEDRHDAEESEAPAPEAQIVQEDEEGQEEVHPVEPEVVAPEDVPESGNEAENTEAPEVPDQEVAPEDVRIQTSENQRQEAPEAPNGYQEAPEDVPDARNSSEAPEDSSEAPESQKVPGNVTSSSDVVFEANQPENHNGQQQEAPEDVPGAQSPPEALEEVLEVYQENLVLEVPNGHQEAPEDVPEAPGAPEQKAVATEVRHDPEVVPEAQSPSEAPKEGTVQETLDGMVAETRLGLEYYFYEQHGALQNLFRTILKAMEPMSREGEEEAVQEFTGFWIGTIRGRQSSSDRPPEKVQIPEVVSRRVEKKLKDIILGSNVYKDLLGYFICISERYQGNPQVSEVPRLVGLCFGFDWDRILKLSELEAPEDSEDPKEEPEVQGTSGILESHQEDVRAPEDGRSHPVDFEFHPVEAEVEASGREASKEEASEDRNDAERSEAPVSQARGLVTFGMDDKARHSYEEACHNFKKYFYDQHGKETGIVSHLFCEILKTMGEMGLEKASAVRKFTGFWISTIRNLPNEPPMVSIRKAVSRDVENKLKKIVLGNNIYKKMIEHVRFIADSCKTHVDPSIVPHLVGDHFGFDYARILELSGLGDVEDRT